MKPAVEGNENGRIVLRAENLWKSYDEGTVTVLKDVDCEVFEGERWAITGRTWRSSSRFLIGGGGFGLRSPGFGRVGGGRLWPGAPEGLSEE